MAGRKEREIHLVLVFPLPELKVFFPGSGQTGEAFHGRESGDNESYSPLAS